MARKVSYIFKGQFKEIQFSYDRFRDKHEAVAAAEGVDLTRFLQMEEQLKSFPKQGAAAKNYRETEFKRMGFEQIQFVRDEDN
ncbi:DUF2960 domain-containing protein [Catenovulum sp. 2E275]|uniref:DUF2960 domain-containing protein n=1 Tax=Catenovulum sp. 2E275 TaxID=2980497 RepID=UPI0021D16798|nr:DUF2960 domain-containing protein [Catenovulum sp. 2E275]MCU4674627.1 DUF2960 domain-containing protein [Catenovulum sp. 2E275]